MTVGKLFLLRILVAIIVYKWLLLKSNGYLKQYNYLKRLTSALYNSTRVNMS